MAGQKIKQASLFGRIGSGLGQGLSEQIPKEVERSRLASGLKDLESQKGLSPFQQFGRLASIPGITPQMIQSGSELLRQQGIGEALSNRQRQEEGQPSPFAKYAPQAQEAPQEGQQRSVTTRTPLEATINPYIPKTREEILQRGGELYNQDRQLYPNPQDAIQAAIQEDQQNQNINTALKGQRQGETDVQNTLREELKKAADTLGLREGINLPGNVLKKIQDKAITKLATGNQTEKEVADEAGKEIDDVLREYADIHSIGKFGAITRPAHKTLSQLERIRTDFEKRDDTRNLADTMHAELGTSYPFSYGFAQPISMKKYPDIAKDLKSLPSLERKETLFETVIPNSIEKTKEISPKLAKHLSKSDASPLAMAYELQKKGYDADTWLNYLDVNRDELNLRKSQTEQLRKETGHFIEPLSDAWLQEWTGLGE